MKVIFMDLSILEESIPYLGLTWFNLIAAFVVLIVGLSLVKIVVGMFKKMMCKTHLPCLVAEFLSRFMGVLLYVAVLLVFVSFLGVNVDSVVLGMSAVIGLILGFGMQDTITNLASGVWIAALRPLDKGDYVTVSGHSGTVNAVGIMATELITPDNQFITIPNKMIWGSSVVNFSRMPTRRVSVNVGISYKSDVDKALGVAMDLMKEHEKILEDPAPAVMVINLGDSSVDLELRAWVQNPDLWSVKWDLTSGIFKAFAEKGIEIPYPQRDVYIKKE